MLGHLIWYSILCVFDEYTICVRVCMDIGWCDIICLLDAIQVVSARDMVRLAQCVCTMSAVIRSILWLH